MMKTRLILFSCLLLALFSPLTVKAQAVPTLALSLKEQGDEVIAEVKITDFQKKLFGLAFNLHFNNEILDYQGYRLDESLAAISPPMQLVDLDRNRLITGIAYKRGDVLPGFPSGAATLLTFVFQRRAEGDLHFFFTKTALATLEEGERKDVFAVWNDYRGPGAHSDLRPFAGPNWFSEFGDLLWTWLAAALLALASLAFWQLYQRKKSASDAVI